MSVKIYDLLFDIFGEKFISLIQGENINKYDDLLTQCGNELCNYQNLSKYGHAVLKILFGTEYNKQLTNYYNKNFSPLNSIWNLELLEEWNQLPFKEFIKKHNG